ncbi:hypothetical protein N3Z16_04615 [Candidatus Megaera polyxenophila]|nr:hypothetical protein N3Z16_04615 [Candidatus Megaera polyxenophila]
MEETFCNRIIPIIPLMAHTLDNMIPLYNFYMAIGSILATTISSHINHLRCTCCQIAISKSLLTSAAFVRSLIDQPIIFLEYKSIVLSRYNQPSSVET